VGPAAAARQQQAEHRHQPQPVPGGPWPGSVPAVHHLHHPCP